jgi:hypothetical protein
LTGQWRADQSLLLPIPILIPILLPILILIPILIQSLLLLMLIMLIAGDLRCQQTTAYQPPADWIENLDIARMPAHVRESAGP